MEIYLSLARKTTALDHAVDYKQNLDEEEERIYLTAINEAFIFVPTWKNISFILGGCLL